MAKDYWNNWFSVHHIKIINREVTVFKLVVTDHFNPRYIVWSFAKTAEKKHLVLIYSWHSRPEETSEHKYKISLLMNFLCSLFR